MIQKRILVFPFDLMSHYLRCMVLLKIYEGNEIFFAFSSAYEPFIKEAGYASFDVEGFDPLEVMKQSAEFRFDWLNIKDIERVYQSQVQVIQQLKPDLVIGDTSPTLKMAAESTGTKYTALMNSYMSKYYKGVRSVSRTHYSYPYLKKLPPALADTITVFAEKAAFRKVHKPFRQLRKKYGLRYISSYLDELEGDENLLCDDPEIFPIKKIPANYKVTGPLLYSTAQKEDELLSNLDPSRHTVCVCLGSSGNWEALAFLSDSEYAHFNFIVAGDKNRILHGAHIHNKDFVNLDEVLPHCSFMICHGGNGTMYEGLKHKKYMFCLTHHFEQEWNVKKLEELSLGQSLNDSPREMLNRKLRFSA